MTDGCERFVDAHGEKVAVGDRVIGIGPATGLDGEVVNLNSDPDSKPFTIRRPNGEIVFLHSAHVELDMSPMGSPSPPLIPEERAGLLERQVVAMERIAEALEEFQKAMSYWIDRRLGR